MPVDTPVTSPVVEPVETIDADPELLQAPPGVKSLTDIVEPVHTADAPPIPEGLAFTVTNIVDAIPATVYDMVAVPGAIPVTTPEVAIVATNVLLLLHVPPAVTSVSAVV